MLFVIERMVNRYLALSDTALQDLSRHAGKSVGVHITDWAIHLTMTIHASHVSLSLRSADADVTVQGKGMAFLQYVRSPASRPHDVGLKVGGDATLLHEVQKIFQSMDIDWEEWWSGKVGDIAAYRLGAWWQKTKACVKDLCAEQRETTSDFVFDELQLSPTREELDEYSHAVGALRDDVERLEHRLRLQGVV